MYSIVFTRHAERGLAALASVERIRVQVAIAALADDPYPNSAIQMSGSTLWRMRVGNYRMIYDIDEMKLIVTIVSVGHRREVYR